MKILSLFDGISCARVAIERAGIPVEVYYASEVDKYAMQISNKNYPDIVQLGSVVDIDTKVLHLSGVYDILKEYDSNIQNKLSEQEMLYWINEDFSVSAKIGTQIKNGNSPEPTSLQCVEEIWFSKSGVGDIIKTRNIERSGNGRSESNQFLQEPILQCGEWWYVYRSNTRSTEKNIRGVNGQKTKTREYRENTTGGNKTIQHTTIKENTIRVDKDRNDETREPSKVSIGVENSQEWSAEEIRNRTEKAKSYVSKISFPLSSRDDNERVTAREWGFLSVRKEMETTVVISSKSIDVFVGTFGILCGGSPCQDLSIAKKDRKGLDGERSGLFWEYVRILKEVKPKYFILENVARMSQESINIISQALNVQPILFNASLLSAQDRPRLFWTNIIFELPKDSGIVLKHILLKKERRYLEIKYPLFKTKRGIRWDTSGKGYFSQANRAYSIEGKSPTVPTCRTITKTKIYEGGKVGELHYEEMEILQGLPIGYTEGIKNKEIRGGLIGNAFNVDVVSWILSFIPNELSTD